jgi:hypothetical protein
MNSEGIALLPAKIQETIQNLLSDTSIVVNDSVVAL